MATLFPTTFPYPNDPGRRAEHQFFSACKRFLNDEWLVLYQMAWTGPMEGRVDDSDADFVLIHPTLGLFTVEVKGGQRISVKDGKWFTVPHGQTNPIQIKDPFRQASNSKRTLFDYIRRNCPSVRLNGSFGHFVVFPGHQQSGDMGPHAPRSLIFDRDDLTNLAESMLSISHYWNQKHRLSSTDVRAIFDSLVPSFDLLGSRQHELSSALEQISFLTELQLRTFSSLQRTNRLRVLGGAGTGKSLLALQRARELQRRGFEVLYLCNSNSLADFVRQLLLAEKPTATPNGDEAETCITVQCWHDAWKLLVPPPQSIKRSDAGRKLSLEYFGETEVQRLFRVVEEMAATDRSYKLRVKDGTAPSFSFDAIVADEAQLIPGEFVEALEFLLREDGALYLFGDPAQDAFPHDGKIFDHRKSALSMYSSVDSHELNLNCRSTLNIATFVENLVDRRIDVLGFSGNDVETIQVESQREVVPQVATMVTKWLNDFGLSPEDIAIVAAHQFPLLKDLQLENADPLQSGIQPELFDNTDAFISTHQQFVIDWTALSVEMPESVMLFDTSEALLLVHERFANEGHPQEIWSAWQSHLNNATEDSRLPLLRVQPSRELHGLERLAVIVLDLRPHFTNDEQFSPHQSLYIACSRAQTHLSVVQMRNG